MSTLDTPESLSEHKQTIAEAPPLEVPSTPPQAEIPEKEERVTLEQQMSLFL